MCANDRRDIEIRFCSEILSGNSLKYDKISKQLLITNNILRDGFQFIILYTNIYKKNTKRSICNMR